MSGPSGRAIIVNADDLGRTTGINRGIFEAHRRGIVSSATLMVGFPAAADAADALVEHPDLGVGLHVVLTGGRPTLPPRAVPSLVGQDGRLPRDPSGLASAAPQDVLAEIRHQVERFTALAGRPPTHLDSHHHAHRLPGVLDALIRVARERQLPVRRASPEVAERLRAAGVRTTDAFVERFYGDTATLETLLDALRSATAGVTEIMCHPGFADEDLRRESRYAAERERELAVLTNPRSVAAMDALGLRLTHFGRL